MHDSHMKLFVLTVLALFPLVFTVASEMVFKIFPVFISHDSQMILQGLCTVS